MKRLLVYAMLTLALVSYAQANAKKGKSVKMKDGLEYQDSVVGTGATAAKGKKVTVNYTGKLKSGKVFDSSIGREPFTFQLGVGQVIKGWDEGVDGMKVGGKRSLTIPAKLGYGERGTGDGTIPPNATLFFDVEVLKVE